MFWRNLKKRVIDSAQGDEGSLRGGNISLHVQDVDSVSEGSLGEHDGGIRAVLPLSGLPA